MFNNPGIQGMANEFAPQQPGQASQAGQQGMSPNPGDDGKLDPGEVLEFFLIQARDDPKAAQAISEFIQMIGEQRFEQLLEGGQWAPEELKLLEQIAMALAPQGQGQGRGPGQGGGPGQGRGSMQPAPQPSMSPTQGY